MIHRWLQNEHPKTLQAEQSVHSGDNIKSGKVISRKKRNSHNEMEAKKCRDVKRLSATNGDVII